ncbi:hypothetical protein DFH07DRAFT_944866 [Mycena maculata]|uniref:DUF6589 domain-containing protein n=1 Tax=Mycena maculata TaxID=230809 RepID=A0AAD7I286_9AGAR|nr:hypothetical protein DFH07DRAFT_944866 [Mycena maculata]
METTTWTARSQITRIASVLEQEAVTASDFVITLLERESYRDHPCTTSLVEKAPEIIDLFSKHPRSAQSTFTWARKIIQKKTADSIKLLTANQDWHFDAGHASAEQLEDFQIEEMAQSMKEMAPDLWNLLHLLLSKDHKDIDGDQVMGGTNDSEFDELGDFAQPIPDGPTSRAERVEKRREGLRTIKIVVMISIMMQSRNNKSNALESVFGIFLHSTNTPEKVIQALAHMGISISPSAIHSAIHALSAETEETLRRMGQTLLVGYAYDNFDINFPTIVPTIEKATDPLTHLTSGALIRLEHGVVLEDLECSEELWAKSTLNPALPPDPAPQEHNLEAIHPESDHPSGLTRRERFNAWKFKADLFEHGPAEFRDHLKILESPEAVEQIPVVKMRYAPARAMDTNQSTHAGNITAIADLLRQGGVGPPPPPHDPNETDPAKIAQRKRLQNLVSLLKYVVLFFGDLGTAERVEGIFLRRSIESTPWLRYQFVIFVMGFFHLKMACADAIWRIFIEPKSAREDLNSLMAYVAQHRPRETGKIGSNPGFRRMHEAKLRNPAINSLEDSAKSKPSITLLDDMANHLAENYVSGGDVDIYSLRNESVARRDKQHENILIMHQYFLLYEELSFSMNPPPCISGSHKNICAYVGIFEDKFPE